MVVPAAGTDPLDVLIVGAGPTGLTAGCLLARRGLKVRIVRKHQQFEGHSRATGIWPRALEILASVGVVEELESVGSRISRLGYYSSGESIGCFEMARLTETRFDFLLAVSQHLTEAALEAAFLAAGGDLTDGAVTELDQDDRQVSVRVRSGGHHASMSARYLIGADGANSTVRELLGIAMTDVGPTLSYRVTDAVIKGLPEDEANYCWTPRGGIGIVPHDRDAYRLAYRLTPASPDSSLASFQRLLDERGPQPAQGTVEELLATADFETRYAVADSFGAGRCYLAGDSAHVMSPAGAQGMNAGILDAAALAWRIEAGLDGTPDDPLPSYGPERQHAIREVMKIGLEHSRDGSLRSTDEITERDRRYRDMWKDPVLHLEWVTRLSQLHLDTPDDGKERA
jgi:2-polyprenyl-6-methoxyphenol hydroxylase-like FAD-dependent oxidoreductase